MNAMNTYILFRMKKSISLFLLMFFITGPLWAQSVDLDEAQREQIANQIEQTKEQLQLSDAQTAAVEEILVNAMTERFAVMQKYGINPTDPNFKRPGRKTARKLRSEMQGLDEELKNQLANHLTPDQMATWETLEKERRDRMRKRLRSGG